MESLTFIDVLIIILIGIIEGITEWLPISSTGHMLLFDEFVPFSAGESFKEMFFVVIQLGAILAVVTFFFGKMLPLGKVKSETAGKTQIYLKKDVLIVWAKIIVACLPSAVVGLIADDWIEEKFGTPLTIALMLAVYGIAFIVIEKIFVNRTRKYDSLEKIGFLQALLIGLFQVLSIIPGTSRSGATIIGALLIGVSRTAAAEFTFYLAVPTMLGASLLKIAKYGFVFTSAEVIAVLLGMAVAYLVSLAAIRFLMDYVKRHDFSAFGIYRIGLAAVIFAVVLSGI